MLAVSATRNVRTFADDALGLAAGGLTLLRWRVLLSAAMAALAFPSVAHVGSASDPATVETCFDLFFKRMAGEEGC